MRRQDRELALARVCERVTTVYRGQEEEALAESLFYEQRRLREAPEGEAERFWGDVQRSLPQGASPQIASLFQAAVRRYADEICGNLNERVYKLSTRVLPPALTALLNAVSPAQLIAARAPVSLEQSVVVQGQIE